MSDQAQVTPEQFLGALAQLAKSQRDLAKEMAGVRAELHAFRLDLAKALGQGTTASVIATMLKGGIARALGGG